MYKKIISAVLAASVCCASTAAMAKSDKLIDSNLDRMRSLLNESDFRVYREAPPEDGTYYGAKFEPLSGVYLGTPANCMYDGIGNAIDTYYEWFEPNESINNYNCERVEIPETPSEHTALVGCNWNFASQTYVNMADYSNYIYNFIDELASRGQDILLIFGKEMNIDDNFLDESHFIDAFRFVADYAHTKENIAMVWAPNDTGGLDTRLIDFYPGDEYVDWIGCSLYTMPYFQGDPDSSEASNIGFIMGPYANPVMRAKVIVQFMEENNINKPVCITEGGVGYKSPSGEDYTEWAQQQLRRYYGEICRRYPQFKCIVSFNNFYETDDESCDYYRYDMGKSPELLSLLQQLVLDPIYLTSYPATSTISYVEAYDGMDFEGSIKLSAYGYEPKAEWLTVTYLIDDEEKYESVYLPYNVSFTVNDVSYGEHTLTVRLSSGDDVLDEMYYDIKFIEPETVWELEPQWAWSSDEPAEPSYIYRDEADNGSCTFPDMTEKPNKMKNAAGFLSEKGFVLGREDGNFYPDDIISRAEISAVMLRMLGKTDDTADGGFDDVTRDDWFFSVAGAAKNEQIISGYPDNTFRGNNSILQQEITSIMAKTILHNVENYQIPTTEISYTDEVASWVYDYAKICANEGVLLEAEDGSFGGEREVTRGNAAIMLKRLYEVIEN
ncbi:MAG: S-layer homology domain-containing protein [Oscillospiraceae bacterium]|nr:S-layer homology domain-containing protein [Oscillospiraceae bacterium]